MEERRLIVAAVRGGAGQRAVARQWRVPLSTVQYWLKRAGPGPLAAESFADQRTGTASAHNRVPAVVERQVLAVRAELRQSALSFCGAEAIREHLQDHAPAASGETLPSLRTIGRILRRHGVLDGKGRRRQQPPPPGWYLPRVAAGEAELESFDVIEDLHLEGGPLVSVFTGRALWRGDAAAWPLAQCVAEDLVECLLEHWRQRGLPAYAQFDNDARFQGSHRYPDLLGRVLRLCLQVRITPVFAPPREHGFQNLIESFNGLWQDKVWARFHHPDLAELQACNRRFLTAWEGRRLRQERAAPRRPPLAADWQFEEGAPPCGEIIYLRRCDETGAVRLLGHTFAVEKAWAFRLVRAEVDLDQAEIRFFRLRRREPKEQSFICRVAHRIPPRPAPRPTRKVRNPD